MSALYQVTFKIKRKGCGRKRNLRPTDYVAGVYQEYVIAANAADAAVLCKAPRRDIGAVVAVVEL